MKREKILGLLSASIKVNITGSAHLKAGCLSLNISEIKGKSYPSALVSLHLCCCSTALVLCLNLDTTLSTLLSISSSFNFILAKHNRYVSEYSIMLLKRCRDSHRETRTIEGGLSDGDSSVWFSGVWALSSQ